jgi:hypothetical protein
MARIRSIKPDFWDDEKIGQISRDARLLFIGLWNHADDEGRMRANSRYVKSKVFPYDDDVQVDGLLAEIACLRMIVLYTVDGQDYLWISNFRKHQRIDRPQPSTLPPPPTVELDEESSPTDPPQFDEHSTNDRRIVPPSRARSLEGNGVDRRGVEVDMEACADAPTIANWQPSWEQVENYFGVGLGRPGEARKFFDYWQARSWISRRTQIRDYQAAARLWVAKADEMAADKAEEKRTRASSNGAVRETDEQKAERWARDHEEKKRGTK